MPHHAWIREQGHTGKWPSLVPMASVDHLADPSRLALLEGRFQRSLVEAFSVRTNLSPSAIYLVLATDPRFFSIAYSKHQRPGRGERTPHRPGYQNFVLEVSITDPFRISLKLLSGDISTAR